MRIVNKPKIFRIIHLKKELDSKTIINNIESKFGLNTLRENRFEVHKNTESVIVRFDTEYENMKEYPFIEEYVKELAKEYGYKNVKIMNAIFAKLPAGKEIITHIDSAVHFEYAHRIHYALKTNSEVVFNVDNQCIDFVQNRCMEINNLAEHYVKNNSNEDRIHLIVDIFNDIK